MGLVDMSFWSVGPTVLTMAWPAFVVFATAQVAAARRVRRLGAPRLSWSVSVMLVALCALVALGTVSHNSHLEWAAREGLQPRSTWARTAEIVQVSTGPTLWIFALGQCALMFRPRSLFLEAALTVATGAALSWALAIWLALQPLPEVMHSLFRVPGSLGAMASLGFVLSGGIWATAARLRSARS